MNLSVFLLFICSYDLSFICTQPEAKASAVKQEAGRLPGSSEAAKRKKTKQKSAAEKKLEDRFITLLLLLLLLFFRNEVETAVNEPHLSISREEALQNADDAEEEKRPKKVKRKAPEADEDGETLAEALAVKRRKVAWSKAEERIKLKRTVFVGNLPVNYSKKVTEFLCRSQTSQMNHFFFFFINFNCFLQDLKKIFKDLGTIESVRFRSVVSSRSLLTKRPVSVL